MAPTLKCGWSSSWARSGTVPAQSTAAATAAIILMRVVVQATSGAVKCPRWVPARLPLAGLRADTNLAALAVTVAAAALVAAAVARYPAGGGLPFQPG